jgi:hypothetical protein
MGISGNIVGGSNGIKLGEMINTNIMGILMIYWEYSG